MRDREFEQWLKNRYPNPNNWRTFRSETRRIAKHKGNLDDIYERDRFKALFDSFRYSKREGIPPTDDIAHNADPYVTADFRRQCLKLYSQFYQEHPRVRESWALPDESAEGTHYAEGAARTVVAGVVNAEPSIIMDVDIHPEAAVEGRQRLVEHLQRERNQTVVRAKKNRASSLACEVCGFLFGRVYGEAAADYCEVHHLLPLSVMEQTTRTRMEDLAILCANCHRVVHLRNPPYTLNDVRDMLAK